MKFCKVFDSDMYIQICVIAGTENKEVAPEVRLFFVPETLGVSSLAIKFEDDNDGYEKRDALFKKIDSDLAESMIHTAVDPLLTNL